MSETGIIEIDVDGITAPVDEDEYNADPDAIVEAVRAARLETVGDAGGHETGPDYDELVAAFGEAE